MPRLTGSPTNLLKALEYIQGELRLATYGLLPGFLEEALRLRGELNQAMESGDAMQVLLMRDRIQRHFRSNHEVYERLRQILDELEGRVFIPNPMRGLEKGWLGRLRGISATRFPDVTLPNEVRQGTTFDVRVQLTIEPKDQEGGQEGFDVDLREPVEVLLTASRCTVVGDYIRPITVPGSTDSGVAEFMLQADEPGEAEISLRFLQGANVIGGATASVQILEVDPAEVFLQRIRTLVLLENDVEPPQRTLIISYLPHGPERALSFELLTHDQPPRQFEQRIPMISPDRYCAELYQRMNLYADGVVRDAHLDDDGHLPPIEEEIEENIAKIGRIFWEDLLPGDFKNEYLAQQEQWRDSQLLIISDEPYIPWEVVLPPTAENEPWALSMALTRWLPRLPEMQAHTLMRSRLYLEKWAALAPTDSNLFYVDEELRVLEEMLGAARSNSPSPPDREKVLTLLKQGEYQWLHVASHGRLNDSASLDTGYLEMQDQWRLEPGDFLDPSCTKHIATSAPGFVFNACHAGRQGWTLTGLAGWAKRLIAAGAGLFMAPLWAVQDDTAARFMGFFYGALTTEKSVSEAVREARKQVRKEGDPSWLAYSVYAHPNARLILR